MTPETINALVQLGAASAVIIVVVYFLRYIRERDRESNERDEQWRQFFESLLTTRDAPMVKLAEVIGELLEEFRTHDTWERTKLEEMSARIGRKTQPRKGGAD